MASRKVGSKRDKWTWSLETRCYHPQSEGDENYDYSVAAWTTADDDGDGDGDDDDDCCYCCWDWWDQSNSFDRSHFSVYFYIVKKKKRKKELGH